MNYPPPQAQDQLQRRLDHITHLLQREYAHSRPAWVIRCRRFLAQARERDYPARYRRLIRGLDARSLACVSRLLGRIELVAGLRDGERSVHHLDVYSPQEKQAMARCRQEFHQQIITLSPQLHAWRDYLLPRREFQPAVLYYRHQLALLRSPEYMQNKAVIDAGAFIGDSALVLRRFCNGPIYSFEPLQEHFALLQRTLELNSCHDIFPLNKALGQHGGAGQLYMSGTGSALEPQNTLLWGVDRQPTQDIEIVTLDDFMRGLGVRVGLIKTDVEGGERALLEGAKETISRDRPVLLLSIYHSAHDFFDLKPLIESWDLGYTFRISRPPLDADFHETLLICEPQGS